MLTVFQILFWIGVGVTALNALLGLIFGIVDFGLDIDFDFDIDFDTGFDFGILLPCSPSLIFLSLLVFGGSGQIFYNSLPHWAALVLALLLALTVTIAINVLVVRPLRKISSKEAGKNSDFVGLNAVVADRIFENGYGKIHFIYDGNTISGPAMGDNGMAIDSGTEVFILAVSGGTYTVKPIQTPDA